MARQAVADSTELKQKLADLEKELEKAQGDKKDLYEGVSLVGCHEKALGEVVAPYGSAGKCK